MLTSLLSELRYRLRALFRRSVLERELDDEIRFHLEQEADKLRREGVGEAEARRRARLALGNVEVTKEAARDARGVAALEHLARDAHYALRAIRRNPGFALVVILTLALGIGANTAIFSVVDAVLLRPLPYSAADRLVTVNSFVQRAPDAAAGSAMALSYPDYEDIGRLTAAVAGVAAYSNDRYNFAGTDGPRELQVTRTTAALFGVLGVAPAIGRTFSSGEMHDPVAVISHALWIESFNGDSTALGRPITLDQKSYTIVGVMPPGFAFPDAATQAWIPIGWALADAPTMAETRMYRAFSTIARLAPGASVDRLRRDLDLMAQRITASGEATSKFGGGESFAATLLRDQVVGDARQPLLILVGAVALVLLIACVNAANLLLARANAREKEFAVRRALGAGRGAIIRQLLVESVFLALAAAAVGLVLAAAGLRVITAQLPQGYSAGIDGTVLGFTLLLTVITGLGFGLFPALRASAPGLEQSLRDSAGGSVGRPRRRARNLLVVSEVALALVLLVSSALLVRSFIDLNGVNPGFDPQGILTAQIRLTPARYTTALQKRTFFDDVVTRLKGRAGVSGITIADGLPLAEINTVGMNPRAIRPEDPDQFLEIAAMSVGPDYFSTMHVPIIKGRAITAEDRAESKEVCVVSQALARRLWPDRDPIGQGGMGGDGNATVVGVAGDVRSESLERAGRPTVYASFTQSRSRVYDQVWLMMRGTHPLRAIPDLQAAVRAEDPTQPIASISTYDAIIQLRYASLRLITALITLFAALALVLAVIGIAGVTAYAVSQRTRELGIRIALGASGADVIALLLGETVILVGLGLTIGLAAALGLTRTLRSLLFGVTTTDVVTYAAAALALGLVALIATYLPARRAGLVDPVEALRQE